MGPGQRETEVGALKIAVQGVGFRPFLAAVFAISAGAQVSTYIFRNRGALGFSISLIVEGVLAFFAAHRLRLFDAPRALC